MSEEILNFIDLGLPNTIVECLNDIKITTPTDIQRKAIPFVLNGKDIIASSQTGTGKTFAFLLPILSKLLENKDVKCLIIEPTRELAQQVLNNIKILFKKQKLISYTLLIGGESVLRQDEQLRRFNPRVIIGTPGRIIDHLTRKTLSLKLCKYLVLDETDRMFDMGFYEQLEKIFEHIPEDKQTLMFSATFPKEIEELAIKHLNNPEKIFVQKDNQSNVVADNLTQEVVNIKDIGEKYKILLEQLISREGTIIVFFQRKIDVDYFGRKLQDDGITTCKIHGDLRQKTRERTINDFKNGRYRILLGTDIVARGLDVPHVKYVINYDIPEDPEEYIHRIGRTARAGENGTAVTFLTNNYNDIKKWENIQFLLHPELKKNNHEFNKNNYRINRKRNTCRNMFSHKRKIFNIRNKIK